MPPSPQLTTIYASDEDAYAIGGADFGVIVPENNLIARGVDGAFSSGDLWTLTSASNDFTAQGAKSGQILQLLGPSSTYKQLQFLAVESVSGSSCILRRAGFVAGIGVPPGPIGGLIGITFKILTLYPQIENAANDLNDQFGIDENIPWRTPLAVYDPRQLRRLSILRVFYELYMSINRSKVGDFADKQKYWQTEYDDTLSATTIHWGQLGLQQGPTNRFSMRIVR